MWASSSARSAFASAFVSPFAVCQTVSLSHHAKGTERLWEHTFATAQGHARTQYRRAIERKNILGAEMALREMGAMTSSRRSTTSPYWPSYGQRRRRARRSAGTAGSRPRRRC
jgi:hypothetical protein